VQQLLHVTVEGRVHGVGFRMCAVEAASELGLEGWVQNCDDGSVELVAEGDPTALAAMLDWCRIGPPMARVDTVRHTFGTAIGESGGFRVRY
jgi:acylphosphatase